MPAADRKKSEDRQLANALTASGYKTRKERLRERLLKCIKRNPTNLPAACAEFHLEVQKARNFDDLWVLYQEYSMDDILVWARQIQEEENAKLRPKIVSSRRDADGAGPSNGASPVSRHPSAGPVRGSAAMTDEERRDATASFAATVRETLYGYDTVVFNGKRFGDWLSVDLRPFLQPEDINSEFAHRVMDISGCKGPLRTARIPEAQLRKIMQEAAEAVRARR